MALNDIMGLLGRAGEVIGGGTPGLYGGLLSEEELRQAKNKASTKALFDLSASLAEAARPKSGRPIGTFGAIAKGLSAAQEGYQGTLQQQAKEKLAMQEMQRQMQAKQRAADAQKLMPNLITEATPARPAEMIGGAPYGMETPAQPGGLNRDVMNQLLALGPEGQKALMDRLALQKTMQGEAFNLAPGDVRYSTDILGEQNKLRLALQRLLNLSCRLVLLVLLTYLVCLVRTQANTQMQSVRLLTRR